jgi:hypothetical protein
MSEHLKSLGELLEAAFKALPAETIEQGRALIAMGEEPEGIRAFPDDEGTTYKWAGFVVMRTKHQAAAID